MLDRATAQGVPRVSVIPNAYPSIGDPVGRRTVGAPPCLLFQGLLSYPPNIDAAPWLAREVGPGVRAQIPDVQVRLVGDHHADLTALDDPPRVTVVGRVPEIITELARADLVVVPVRYGSGTRIKILEAFRHRMPVVSTTLGAEGLGVEDGVHLLIGDIGSGVGRRPAPACSATAQAPRGHHEPAPSICTAERFRARSSRRTSNAWPATWPGLTRRAEDTSQAKPAAS